jgi:hypothetical protein
MDTLQLKIYGLAEDIIGGDCFLVDYIINGRSLMDMVREAELPFATAEGHPGISGSYIGLSPGEAFSPYSFLLNKWILWDDKAAIFKCAGCGDDGCWGFYVRITIGNQMVTWDGYENNHRKKWNYAAIPAFTFDLEQYLAALQPPAEGVFVCPECGSGDKGQSVMVEPFQNENDPWSDVAQYDYCKRCGYPIPGHLGKWRDGLTFQEVRIVWVNLYRSAKSRPRKLPRPRLKTGEHWGMADLIAWTTKVENKD